VFTTTFVATTVEVQVVASVGMVGVVPFPAAPDAWLKIQETFLKSASLNLYIEYSPSDMIELDTDTGNSDMCKIYVL
jgi:hypothetical protein